MVDQIIPKILEELQQHRESPAFVDGRGIFLDKPCTNLPTLQEWEAYLIQLRVEPMVMRVLLHENANDYTFILN